VCNPRQAPGPGCCCQPGSVHAGYGHPFHFRPEFPTREEQVEILKKYRQKLKQELDEVEGRLKELE